MIDIREHGGMYAEGGGGKDDGGSIGGDFDVDSLLSNSLNKTNNVLGAFDEPMMHPAHKRIIKVINGAGSRYQSIPIGSRITIQKERLESDDIPSGSPVSGVTSSENINSVDFFAVGRSGSLPNQVYYRDVKKGRELEVKGINDSNITFIYQVHEYDLLCINGNSWYDVSNPTQAVKITPPESPSGIVFQESYNVNQTVKGSRLFHYDNYLCSINKVGSKYILDYVGGTSKDHEEAFVDHDSSVVWSNDLLSSSDYIEIEKPEKNSLVHVTNQGKNSIYYFYVSSHAPAAGDGWSYYSMVKYKFSDDGKFFYQGHLKSVTSDYKNIAEEVSLAGHTYISNITTFTFNVKSYPKSSDRFRLVITPEGQEFYMRDTTSRAVQSYAGSGKKLTSGIDYLENAYLGAEDGFNLIPTTISENLYDSSFQIPPFAFSGFQDKNRSAWYGYPTTIKAHSDVKQVYPEEYYELHGENYNDKGMIGICLETTRHYLTVFIL